MVFATELHSIPDWQALHYSSLDACVAQYDEYMTSDPKLIDQYRYMTMNPNITSEEICMWPHA